MTQMLTPGRPEGGALQKRRGQPVHRSCLRLAEVSTAALFFGEHVAKFSEIVGRQMLAQEDQERLKVRSISGDQLFDIAFENVNAIPIELPV